MGCEYSPNERRLISEFGYGSLCDHVESPHSLYRMCAEYAFTNDLHGPAVEALRRVMQAFNRCSPYRMTAEFEALVSF